MKRSTGNFSRQAQALFQSKIEFTCDEVDASKRKPGVFYVKHAWLHQANLGALLVGFLFVVSYLCGGLSGTASESPSTIRSMNTVARNNQVIDPVIAPAIASFAPTTIQPLSCTNFLHEVRSGSYRILTNVNDPNKKEYIDVSVKDPNEKKGHFHRRTITEFPFGISLHHEKFDPRRWNIYKHGRYFQHALEDIWTNILSEASPGARIIDIGGLIGYYALLSASMGQFKIDSFEPNGKNNIRLCESMATNHWVNEWEQTVSADRLHGKGSINVWPVGISDKTGNFKFFESYGNPGGGRFVDSMHERTDSVNLPVTTLDAFAEEMGWFYSRPTIAILQMDVEEYDPNVLVGAQKLLKAGLVKNVFTEVRTKEHERRSVEIAAHELLVQAGYKLKGQGGWSGPGNKSIWPDDAKLIENIFDYMEKENKDTLKLWWGL